MLTVSYTITKEWRTKLSNSWSFVCKNIWTEHANDLKFGVLWIAENKYCNKFIYNPSLPRRTSSRFSKSDQDATSSVHWVNQCIFELLWSEICRVVNELRGYWPWKWMDIRCMRSNSKSLVVISDLKNTELIRGTCLVGQTSFKNA